MAFFKVMSNNAEGQGPKYHDDNAIRDVLGYVLAEKKCPSGCKGSIGCSLRDAVEQMEMLAKRMGKYGGIRLRHKILSFQPVEPISVYLARELAERVAWYYGEDYQIVYAVHEDANCLNIHWVMNTVSWRTGRKHPGTADEYARFVGFLGSLLWSEYGLCLTVGS